MLNVGMPIWGQPKARLLSSAPRLAVRHPRLMSTSLLFWQPEDRHYRVLPVRLGQDTLPVERDDAQQPTAGVRRRHCRADDSLDIERVIVAGCDWGACTANIVAARVGYFPFELYREPAMEDGITGSHRSIAVPWYGVLVTDSPPP